MAFDIMSYSAVNNASAEQLTQMLGISISALIIIAVAIVIIKGLALYKAARLKEKVWFWVLIVTNTMAILPIIYLIIKRKKKV